MNVVGIDVSKGKSMVAALRPFGEVVITPQEFLHDKQGLTQLISKLKSLGQNTKIIMEATGRYHEPIAEALLHSGFYVSVLNPILIHQSRAAFVRKVKSDQKDSLKIAKYGLDNWNTLHKYSNIETLRQHLKLFNRQYSLYMKTIISLKNNLISLSDRTFPCVNTLFTSPMRADGHIKWVDFFLGFGTVNVYANQAKMHLQIDIKNGASARNTTLAY